jgi:hypothetical protein
MVHIKLIAFIVFLLNFLVFQVFSHNARKNYGKIISNQSKMLNNNDFIKITFLIGLHLLLFLIGVNFSAIGVAGNFSYPFLFTTSVVLFYFISDKKVIVKYLIYGFILVLYTKYNFGSKREILYILMLIIFFELIKRPHLKLTLKQTFTFLSIGILAVLIVIISSIFRGYGSYEVSGIVDTFKAAGNYVGSEIFKNAFVENFELNTSFCNAFNSYELLFNHKIDYQYGLSFLRIFLMPIPSTLIPWKPERFILIYTEEFNKEFYSIGGSLPTTIYSEAFANFSYLSILFIPLLFHVADSIFYFATSSVIRKKLNTLVIVSIFSSITAMQFIRGSGLDLYILYILFSVPYVFILIWFQRLSLNMKHSTKKSVSEMSAKTD